MGNMTLGEIHTLFDQKEYSKARARMDALKESGYLYTDEIAVLDAGIYEALGDRKGMFQAVRDGLRYSCDNYELYYMLGYYYLPENVDQAYLCFQNALLYCDREADAAVIAADMEELAGTGEITVRNTAIVIVSYNACYMMQKNIESIRKTLLPGTYRIIVVDNASSDGVREWLREQEDIILLENEQNTGFAPACNQAVRALQELSGEQEDIFLLNNDTRLAPNSLFWLRMGLYEGKQTGATGSLASYAGNNQQLDITFTLPEEYLDYGAKQNIPDESPYEERVRLSGFAMLVRGHIWNEVGGMDEAFAPGYFEDDDLSMKILKAGYRLFVCRNSFIYHEGSHSFSQCRGADDMLLAHYRLFIEKYGFDIFEYAYPKEDITGIPFTVKEAFNLLQIGSGLGADLKYIRTVFPNANVVGIEKDDSLYKISEKTEVVFPSLASAMEVFQHPMFHVLFIDEKEWDGLDKAELDLLRRLCLDSCVVLPKRRECEEDADIRLDQVKLVIWDMDQTFWTGILSEGNVTVQRDNVTLIRDMTDCGIMNSVSSKNNEAEVLQALEQLGIADCFVFNNINWENKGEQIRRKLEDMRLRPENVLFIDDDPRNLEEGKYYCPGLMTAQPDVIHRLQKYVKGLEHSDLQHKRLEHYKVLEERRKEESSALTKEKFLYDSNIVLEIHQNCMKELSRIAELAARTNQLNYTKIRDSREQLKELLKDDTLRSGYVRVRDRFGDYGVVGFFCYDTVKKKLRHFLFSCRIIGMGVAECVYEWLGKPQIDVVEPVAAHLDERTETPWIHVDVIQADAEDDSEDGKREDTNKIKVLFKGSCDMSAMENYLSGGDLTTEFNYVNNQGFITTGQNHSMHIWQSAMLSEKQIADMIAEVPFIIPGDFQTSIFSREYHVICYSLLQDCHTGLYRKKNTGEYISFGSKNFDLTDPRNRKGYIDGSIVNHLFPFTEEIIDRFARDWEFVGMTSGEDLIRNLDYMYTHAIGNPMFILLLGSETEYEGINEEFADHAEHHKEINDLVKAYAKDKDRIRIIEMTEFIHSQEDYEDSINHFSRNVYYQLAARVCSFINDKVEMLKGNREKE